MKVEIKCKGSSFAKLEDIKVIQGNLKELSNENYEKLKQSIIELGFSAPFFVWKHKGELNSLDGTQRCKALLRMKDEGVGMPKEFPVVEIEADNYRQAKKKILAISSNYGKMTQEGLKDFMQDIDLEMDEVMDSFHFDALDLKSDLEKGFDEQDDIEDNNSKNDSDRYILEIQLPTQEDLKNMYDEMLERNIIVRVK